MILDAGRMTPKFAHGRGVRQGSVGGAYQMGGIHALLADMDQKQHEGKGVHYGQSQGNRGGRRVTSSDVCR